MFYRLIGQTSSREVSIDIDVDRVFEVGQRVAISLADPFEFEEVRITKLADVACDDGYIVAAIQPAPRASSPIAAATRSRPSQTPAAGDRRDGRG